MFEIKILIIAGFIFFSPVSLDLSVPNINGWDLKCSARHFSNYDANVSLRVANVLAPPQTQAYNETILLPGNMSLNRRPRWSAVTKVRLNLRANLQP